MRVRAVCFDLGGVLVRICHTWSEASRAAGLSREWNQGNELTESSPLARYQNGDTDLDEYLSELIESLRLGTRAEALALHNHILVSEYEGVRQLVEELEIQGLKVGCLSNTNAAHWSELVASDRFPVMDLLRPKLASHNAGLSKPDPRFYKLFEVEAAVDPTEIAYFDDGPLNVRAAMERGWHACQVDPCGIPVDQMRSYLASLGVTV